MQTPEYTHKMMLAIEGLIRRAAALQVPLMLKGSMLSRQYFKDPTVRYTHDVDWVYLDPLIDQEHAVSKLDPMMIAITESKEFDGIRFRSFRENQFWRKIDYAMADDFPTINTDILTFIGEEEVEIRSVDISFNLEIDPAAVPLTYVPLTGEPFVIPYTAPLALQVSWKLHQTLVNPRLKDLFDLTHLLQHPQFTAETRAQTIRALLSECRRDRLPAVNLAYLASGQIHLLFTKEPLQKTWNFWRLGLFEYNGNISEYSAPFWNITDADKLPLTVEDFIQDFYTQFYAAGFDKDSFAAYEQPSGKV
ncbi:nucleotidyl transferase AbiEii/AbiGii toxin family protein [Chitinophaga arvensicola]|uniref:Nucleotidyl transferase AbiEii toxin, Type IV TA system n=1 Tax=Chitinophaga arvensicola TaxID=29529 RepID=A0A1I0RG50_9BACT|nr:nucleotidyl transferase AbiEii/AbiGii toxin family protein [Chitinophaga arvensicola]SEW39827.1 Nucleotidyl transferase AbiEii toxin, Type IV TA system [Chitinophaga arvensicola]